MTVSRLLGGFAAAMMGIVGLASPASAQDWPTKPITIVVPYAAGGGADFVARLMAESMATDLGQQVLVEARGGAGATIGAAYVAKSAPDGYTLMLTPVTPIITAPHLYPDLPYDPKKAFTPISMVIESPFVMMVNKDLPVNTVKEYIEHARQNPGQISAGNSGPGSFQFTTGVLLEDTTGIDLNLVPYKGTGELMPDLIAGRLSSMFDFPGPYRGAIDAGQIRLIGNFSQAAVDGYPDLPAVQADIPDFPIWSVWFGLYGPENLPRPIVDRINKSVHDFLAKPESVARLATNSYVPKPSTPEQVTEQLEAERGIIDAMAAAGKLNPQ